jgi:small subunit ribosomal protein S20
LPITKSARKQMRVSERKRLRNQPIRSHCKTTVTKAEKLIFSGKLDEAGQAVTEAISTLDKAAKIGVIHANNAARRKSRLMKKLNAAMTPAQEPAV